MAGNHSAFRPGLSWTDRWNEIAGSDSSLPPLASSSRVDRRSTTNGFQGRSLSQPGRSSGMPLSVQEDLEEYLNRLDGSSHDQPVHSDRNDGSDRLDGRNPPDGLPATIPSIPRFSIDDIAKLRRFRYQNQNASSSSCTGQANSDWRSMLETLYTKHNPAKLPEVSGLLQKYRGREAHLYSQVCAKYGVVADADPDARRPRVASAPDASSSEAGSECHICLTAFGHGDLLLELPCTARHRFHKKCIEHWLAKSVTCPLCRTDVKALLPATDSATAKTRKVAVDLAARRRMQPSSIRRISNSCAQTALGGTVLRYEPNPPSSWERPSYIPAHVRHLAQYLEVNYLGRGVAKIWRVPNSATSELSRALPLEAVERGQYTP